MSVLAVHQRMDQTVTVHTHTGYGAYGDPTFSTAGSTHAARVEGVTRLVKSADGRDILAQTIVYLGYTSTGGAPAAALQDRLTLPDGSQPPILAIDTHRMRSGGTDHQKVYCG